MLLLLAFGASAAGAAMLVGQVEQGGSVISDADGVATIEIGTTATVSILLELADGEDASVFEGVFDLSVFGLVGATADVAAVEAEWTSVAENTAGSQSTWSDLSAPLGGDRLVAQWSIDATAATDGDFFGVFLGAGTFAGTDLDEAPFFELLTLDNAGAELLAQVNVVTVIPEPGTAALLALGLSALGTARRSRR